MINIKELGKIKIINPDDIWKNEERDFTPWLAKNIGELSRVIGIPLEVEQIEKRVGNYELDIYGKVEGTNNIVVIENQLYVSDHKHLGQLITYASGLNASIIIWVTPKINDEHKRAIEWLNEISSDETSFFLIRPEVISIGDSKPAVRFYVESSPSDFERTMRGIVSKNESKSHQLRRMFWSGLIKYCEANCLDWGVGRRTTKDNWMNFSVGKSGYSTTASLAMKSRLKVEITIDTGDKLENERVFDKVYDHRDEIKGKFEIPVSWEKLENSKVSRIAVYRNYDKKKLEDSPEYRQELYLWLAQNMNIMRKVYIEYLVNKSII